MGAPTASITAIALSLVSTGNAGTSTELIASTSTDGADPSAAASAASPRFSIATASCSAGSTPSIRFPYAAFSRLHPVRRAISAQASMFSRNALAAAGTETSPRSPAAMSPV